MMDRILKEFIKDPTIGAFTVTITKKDVEDYLYEICDREHASCNSACPVYERRRNDEDDLSDCPYHKDGHGMLSRLRIREMR